jgi:GntR family carbon starvation induced transcriptional regulator
MPDQLMSDPKSDASATQRTYHLLRRMIVTGQLQPGEKLKIDALRGRLDTGASPIREALSLLTSDNLVERIDQRGFRATAISHANFEEILRLRCDLEAMALRLSIANRTDAWEEKLVLSHHRMSRAQGRDEEAFEDLHKAFHIALLDNCDSPILLRFCSQLYDLNIRYRYILGGLKTYRTRDISAEHQAILTAAIEGDADRASERLLEHYRKTGAFLAEVFGAGVLVHVTP